MTKIYTKKGDRGQTSLLFGTRVEKNNPRIKANGDIDELQSFLGMARSLAKTNNNRDIESILAEIEKDLWILMAEVATENKNRHKLIPGKNLVTHSMVNKLETNIDSLMEKIEIPKDFVIPGDNQLAATIDIARAVTRRAERSLQDTDLSKNDEDKTFVFEYINRLSDFLWTLARSCEQNILRAKDA